MIQIVFPEGEQIDIISVGKGRGWQGVVHRFGTELLQKKTPRGRRKVACIGQWHPMRVLWCVARVGNNGFHRTPGLRSTRGSTGSASSRLRARRMPPSLSTRWVASLGTVTLTTTSS